MRKCIYCLSFSARTWLCFTFITFSKTSRIRIRYMGGMGQNASVNKKIFEPLTSYSRGGRLRSRNRIYCTLLLYITLTSLYTLPACSLVRGVGRLRLRCCSAIPSFPCHFKFSLTLNSYNSFLFFKVVKLMSIILFALIYY